MYDGRTKKNMSIKKKKRVAIYIMKIHENHKGDYFRAFEEKIIYKKSEQSLIMYAEHANFTRFIYLFVNLFNSIIYKKKIHTHFHRKPKKYTFIGPYFVMVNRIKRRSTE